MLDLIAVIGLFVLIAFIVSMALSLATTEENPKVIHWLQQQGIQVQFVSEEEYSLEDVYLKLLGNGGR